MQENKYLSAVFMKSKHILYLVFGWTYIIWVIHKLRTCILKIFCSRLYLNDFSIGLEWKEIRIVSCIFLEPNILYVSTNVFFVILGNISISDL